MFVFKPDRGNFYCVAAQHHDTVIIVHAALFTIEMLH